MTTTASGFPEWIRRKLLGRGDAPEEGATARATSGTTTGGTTTGGTTTGGKLDQSPVVVWEAVNPMEAEIVKSRLEAEGIPAIIRTEAVGQLYGLTMGGLAAADVLVPAPLADQAIALLESEMEEVDAGDEDEPDDPGSVGSAPGGEPA